jgi:hypothetical protein
MKNIRSFMHSLITCGVALAMVSTLTAQTAIQGKAKVIRIKGSARFTSGNNVWQPLRAGDTLRPGSVIQTGLEKGSYVDLALGDGSGSVAYGSGSSSSSPTVSPVVNFQQPKSQQNFVRIWENSLLGIDKLSITDTGADTVTDTQLDLKAGHIFGNVKKMSAASKYEVKLPNGVAGIRGTIYDITAEGVVKVSSGSVVLAYVGADGTVVTQVVNGSQKFDARTGQLSPLSTGEMRSLEDVAALGHGGATTVSATTAYQVDHTVYRTTSPHHNKNDPDNDGDNDRGNGHGNDPDNDPI